MKHTRMFIADLERVWKALSCSFKVTRMAMRALQSIPPFNPHFYVFTYYLFLFPTLYNGHLSEEQSEWNMKKERTNDVYEFLFYSKRLEWVSNWRKIHKFSTKTKRVNLFLDFHVENFLTKYNCASFHYESSFSYLLIHCLIF